jgi:hypothetical protein
LELKKQGVAKFVFSEVLVYENLPVNPEGAALSLARFDSIAKFCEGNCLPPVAEVIRCELQALASQDVRYKKLAKYKFSGNWFQKLEIDGGLSMAMRDGAREALRRFEASSGRNLGRNSRRVFEKKFINSIRSGENVELAVKMISEIGSKYPIDITDNRIFYEYLRTGNNRILITAIEKSLSDVRFFCDWCVENWDEGQAFVRTLRGGNEPAFNSLTVFYERMKDVNIDALIVLTKKQMSSTLERVKIERLQWFINEFIAKRFKCDLGIKIERGDSRFLASMEKTPSILCWLEFIAAILFRSAAAVGPRNPIDKAASDFADALHVMFLPRVDIFRADKFASGVIKDFLSFKGSVVESSLEQLPAAVRKVYGENRSL